MTFANSSLVADKSQPTDGRDDGATTRLVPRLRLSSEPAQSAKSFRATARGVGRGPHVLKN